MEHWNSVQIKFNVTREAADRLKNLVDNDDNTLRDLGILAVQIDNDRVVKLNLASNQSPQQNVVKRNDTLTKLLERSSPPTTSKNLPFIVNKRIDNIISVQPQQPIIHQVIASSSQATGELVNRPYQNATNKLPNTKLQTHDSTIGRQIQINSSNINPSICNSNLINSSVNHQIHSSNHQSIGGQGMNKNVQTFTYVNMQQQQQPMNQPVNQLNQINNQLNQLATTQMNSQLNSQINNQLTSPLNNAINSPLNQMNSTNNQMTNQINKPMIGDKNMTIKSNNLIALSGNNKINLSPMNQANSLSSNIPAQSVVQQIQLKYPSQPNNSTATVVGTTNANLIGNIVSIKPPYVRNPNIKINTNQIQLSQVNNQPINQVTNQTMINQPVIHQTMINQPIINQPINQVNNSNTNQQPQTLALNSQLSNQPNNSASNVALTSPLLVNLLQSDVNDHYNSSNSTHLTLSSTLNNSNNSSTIKEPPAKKAKTKKTRKPKDKPPDQLNQSISKPSITSNSSLVSPKNEMTNTLANTSPSNNQQPSYSNTIVNSSLIAIPSVTLSTGANNIQTQKQSINNVVTSAGPYQTGGQFVSTQPNCSYMTNNQYASASNSSMIVNQIKLTNSEVVQQVQHPVTSQSTNNQYNQPSVQLNNQLNNHQLNQQTSTILESYPSSHSVTQQQPIIVNNLKSINNMNINKSVASSSTSITNTPLITNSSANYFQKLSSLTKESVQPSNLIVQNATIVNSTIVNTSTITLNHNELINNTLNSPILPHKSDSFLNLPSPIEQNKTKHLINPFTGQLEPMNSEDEEETDSTVNSSVSNASNNTLLTNSNDNSTKNSTCVNTTSTIASSTSTLVNGPKSDLKSAIHFLDTDSGILKSTNDASSHSSTEIAGVELLNNQDHHKSLNEPNLLDSQSSLMNFDHNESIIGESTILKNKLVNDMLTSSSEESFMGNNKESIDQVYILNNAMNALDKNKGAIESDQIDDYFNTDLGDFHALNSDHSLMPDSNAITTPTNNLLQSTSSNLIGNEIANHHSQLNVNDFLTTPDLNDQQAFGGATLVDNSLESGALTVDHNYTNSGDHNYTNLKRCAFNSNSNLNSTTGNNSTTSNMCVAIKSKK